MTSAFQTAMENVIVPVPVGTENAKDPSLSWYFSLLGLAEHFKRSKNYQLCLHCLHAVFQMNPSPRIAARTNLQIGKVLADLVELELAVSYLEQAKSQSATIQCFEDVHFESSSLLALCYQKLGNLTAAKEILTNILHGSDQFPYWLSRILFQLTDLYVSEGDYATAIQMLDSGAQYSHHTQALYNEILFILSKGLLLLVSKQYQLADEVLASVSQLLANFTGMDMDKEPLKIFFFTLQVSHFLSAGKPGSVSRALKQMQTSITNLSTLHQHCVQSNLKMTNEQFEWLSREQLCVLVYLMTVLQALQCGQIERAQKFADKALSQLDQLHVYNPSPILRTFRLLLLEALCASQLAASQRSAALNSLTLLTQAHHPAPQLHTLLAMYGMSTGQYDLAERQFNSALSGATSADLWTFINLNLAVLYLNTGRMADFHSISPRVHPNRISAYNCSLKAAALFVQALYAYYEQRFHEVKQLLQECLKQANAEELNKLTSISLLLLAHVFLTFGNIAECINMARPAQELAHKLPDQTAQLWSNALLQDAYRLSGDAAQCQNYWRLHAHTKEAQVSDYQAAVNQPQHMALLYWHDGPHPTITPQ